ncbi:hypothetical protein ABPG72_008560 [Tetrahymena utriculariae]
MSLHQNLYLYQSKKNQKHKDDNFLINIIQGLQKCKKLKSLKIKLSLDDDIQNVSKLGACLNRLKAFQNLKLDVCDCSQQTKDEAKEWSYSIDKLLIEELGLAIGKCKI